MSIIRGIQTVNGVLILDVDTDPSVGSGANAPVSSLALTADNSGFFVKTSAGLTGWSKVAFVKNREELIGVSGTNFVLSNTYIQSAIVTVGGVELNSSQYTIVGNNLTLLKSIVNQNIIIQD
jgi:hypothetical protein